MRQAYINTLLSGVFVILLLTVPACAADISRQTPPDTPTVFIITATIPATDTPRPSPKPEPATVTPTIPPVEGTTTTQLNVRAQPSTAAESLGLLPAFSKVQIIGKDSGEGWYLIRYDQAPNGTGWVTAQFVQTQGEPDVPVIGAAPTAQAGSGAASGVITQQVNVRSGPGTTYNALGTLNPQDVVTLTGKDPNGAWLQIEFPGGPEDKGWVAAGFVQAQGVETLPIITEAGQIVGTGTAAPLLPTVTPTLVAAPPDGDSAQSPAVDVTFTPGGAQSFSYSSDVSSPTGDAEDWLQFTPYAQAGEPVLIAVILTCVGNSPLVAELWQGGKVLQTWDDLACGETRQLWLNLFGGAPYSLRMSAAPSTGGLNYVKYTALVQSSR